MDYTTLRNRCCGIVLAGAILCAILPSANAQICTDGGGSACHSVSEDFTISGGTPDFFLTDTDVGQSEWKFLINSSSSVGPSFFELVQTGTATPFRIDGGARGNSIRVLNDGRVGLGTATPAHELHIMDAGVGFGPAIQFQDNNGQNWQLEADNFTFAAFDETEGSRPFQIETGAPDSSLYVNSSGNIGIGTTSPYDGDGFAERFLQVWSNDDARLVVNYGAASPEFGEFMFQSGSVNKWSFGSWNTPGGDNDFYIFNYLRKRVDLGIDGTTGNLILGGTCSDSNGGGGGADGCDGVFQSTYSLPSIEEHAEYMWEHKHLPAVGATPDEKAIQFSVQNRHFAVLNELEKAHIYIEQLNEQLKQTKKEKDTEITALRRDNAELASRLDRIESLLAESSR